MKAEKRVKWKYIFPSLPKRFAKRQRIYDFPERAKTFSITIAEPESEIVFLKLTLRSTTTTNSFKENRTGEAICMICEPSQPTPRSATLLPFQLLNFSIFFSQRRKMGEMPLVSRNISDADGNEGNEMSKWHLLSSLKASLKHFFGVLCVGVDGAGF